MAKKLNEAVVRRFQKLANVAVLKEMYNEEYMKEEEEMDMDAEEGDMGEEAPMDDMDADMDADMDMEDDMDADMGDDVVEVGEEEIASAKQALEDALKIFDQILPGGMSDMEGEDMDFDAEEAPMPDAEEEADMDMEDELMEALRGINYKPSQSEIVNEVAMRVARRLKQAKLHEAKLNRALGRK